MNDRALIAYRLTDDADYALGPAPSTRDWMDATPDRYARRCLPLVIANQHGWWITLTRDICVSWQGPGHGEICVDEGPRSVSSHFGSGVVTFNLPWLFRTPHGWDLHVRGPANYAKDGIVALEGIVETDWVSATFTMNWRATRNGTWRWEAGEPIAMLCPVRRGEVEEWEPHVEEIEAEERDWYAAWAASRNSFIAGGVGTGAWQRHYMLGRHPNGPPGAPDHRTRLHVRDFETDR